MKSHRPKSQLYTLHISLQGVTPIIWRQFMVRSDTRLSDLHKIVQTVMGWINTHLHSFEIGRHSYSIPFEDSSDNFIDSTSVILSDVVNRKNQKFQYVYDFGDNWIHNVILKSVSEQPSRTFHPVCLDGARSSPPEDCGGSWGYRDLLSILADPTHEEYAEKKDWVGDLFDPEKFNLTAINKALRRKNFGV